MNAEYVQNLRYKLQKRIRRLNSTSFGLFHISLKQFWGFLEDNTVFMGILEDLGHRYPSLENEAESIINGQAIISDTELEHAAISYFLIKKCVESDNDQIEVNIGFRYQLHTHNKTDEFLESFKDVILEPFYEYLDEQLDDQKATLALLRRYKHKCEWFQRENLFDLSQEQRKGEKNLSLHLYEYLHDQGIDFTIEPASASGEADLVAAQNSEDPLIADTKIFDGDSRGKSYIAKGFNQIYLYTLDYNEPFGYLIIFNTSGKDLRLALTNQTQSTPFVIHNNKTIFIITIDIFPHETTASTRGPLNPVEITEEYLIRISEEEEE
jgi:hypothetical protein